MYVLLRSFSKQIRLTILGIWKMEGMERAFVEKIFIAGVRTT